LIVRGTFLIPIEESESGSEVGCCLIDRVHAQAFAACHREISEGFTSARSLAVVMSQNFGHFSKAVAAAALDFLGDLQMQRNAHFTEQTLIECVANQCVLK
jgi:hypothetical protein